ncbi:hypothetical protein BKE38_04035 [Pseudoroseomonas deserti]|uniref:Uncharacterized protein n=1 Tax=Teichococcus deserti TaxID=1817963 RepID=A0A1V2H7M6_9PROT|nr:hypothetical protein [Pseudoroseomonas deserti]ONG57329.1 hypothetical protein BKE38_04035 [Pseudoroseomonas deserti]
MINVEHFRKLWVLTSSSNQHEADQALRKATMILAADGKTLDDVPGLLAGFAYSAAMESLMDTMWGPGSAHAAERAAKRQAVIDRYGSKEAALAPTEWERLLDGAVEPFKLNVQYRFSNGTYPTESLGGWMGTLSDDEPPSDVREAVERAYPLPRTIDEAKVEKDRWALRCQDLHDLLGIEAGDMPLSLAAYLRSEIVTHLFETELRAKDVYDVISRVIAFRQQGMDPTDVQMAAIQADLEGLL